MLFNLEKFRKDAKFFMNEDFLIDDWDLKILDAYREFLKLNKGFVKVKTTDDIKIPEIIQIPEDLESVEEKINEVIESGNLFELKSLVNTVLR